MKFQYILFYFTFFAFTSCNYKDKLTAENIRVSPLYSPGMILQTGQNTIIQGYADPESILAVKIKEYIKITRTDSSGKWEAIFPEILLNKPFDITIEGRDTVITIQNVQAGKVFILLGDARLKTLCNHYENHSDLTDSLSNSRIWIFTRKEEIPFSGKWMPVENISNKTCLVVKWINKLYGESHTPIGFIDATWPSAKVEAWLKRDNSSTEIDSLNPAFNPILSDSITDLTNNSYNGIHFGVSRIWFNDENWRTTKLPVDFSDKEIPTPKRIIYLRKKIYVSSKYLTSDFTIDLGYISGEAEFYFNQEKILPDISNEGYYRLNIPDTLMHEWSNLLCVRLFINSVHPGLLGPDFTCHNADSGFYQEIGPDWKYNYMLEPDFPDFCPITSKPGVLYHKIIADIYDYPAEELIWYGGYFNMEEPKDLANNIQEILEYFTDTQQRSVLFTPFTPLDTILYGKNTVIVKQELKQASENVSAKWKELGIAP